MPRKPHFVLAARRWGWPLSPSSGRVGGHVNLASWDGSRRPKPPLAGSVHDSPAAQRDADFAVKLSKHEPHYRGSRRTLQV